MDYSLEKNCYIAKLMCSGKYFKDLELFKGFAQIYPFTTENISGYIDLFDLNDKSLLTLGSSCDHIINAALFNCTDQTIIDICPFTKYYFYLKKAAILELCLNDYYNFFFYSDYPKFCSKNKDVFNKVIFNRIKELLKCLDYDSFFFWDELFSLYDSEAIRKRMFSYDEDRDKVIKTINLYMKNEMLFNKTKDVIRNIEPTFICDDITNIKLDRMYDNAWLSNLGQYIGIDKLNTLIQKILPFVNEKILLCYLYNTQENSKYQNGWAEIYNLDKVNSIIGTYITSFDTFTGVKGILFEDETFKRDSVLMCDKKKLLSKSI